MDIFFEELTKIIMEIFEKSILEDKLQEKMLIVSAGIQNIIWLIWSPDCRKLKQ